MGRDKRQWRKLVKKLRRKRKRQHDAVTKASISIDDKSSDEEDDESPCDPEEIQVNANYFLSREIWEEREAEAELELTMKQIEMERNAKIEAENQKKIREEWEAKQEQERMIKEEKERLEKELKEKQVLYIRKEAEFDEFLSFLSGDIETPPTKYLLPDSEVDEGSLCYYFARTAACRFYERCTKAHPRPTLSTAILIPNFFTHFKLEHAVRDEYDTDLGLEYEDKELYKEFMEFYEDVVPELRKYGSLLQFKVCCNLEPHLRGNVYLQYATIKESVEAYRKLNGRFFNGKQLSLQFIKMDSWRSAICGAYLRKACVKGRTCNFLHVFRNPTKEFVNADRDWKETVIRNSFRQPGLPGAAEVKINPTTSTANGSLSCDVNSALLEQRQWESTKSKDGCLTPYSSRTSVSQEDSVKEVQSKRQCRKRSKSSRKHKKKKKRKDKKHKKEKRKEFKNYSHRPK